MTKNTANVASDPSAPIVEKISETREKLWTALFDGDFYLELMLVGIAIALAVLVSYAVRFRVNPYLENNTFKKLDKEFITKPLALLSSALAYLFLNMVKPIAIEYSKNSLITDAAIQMCIYYIVAKLILLIIKSRLVASFIAFVIMVIAFLDVSGFMEGTTDYLSKSLLHIGSFKLSMLNLVNGFIILVVVLWIAGLLSSTLESYLRRSSALSYNARELFVKFFRVFIYFVALMIALSVFGVDLTAFAVFGGAIGVGIGLGLQKITANFLSGITLLLEKSIMIGDLIEVAGNSGHVREMNVRYAIIETADGRELLIPNEELTSTRVTNWTHSNEQARVEIKVTLDYETNAKAAIKHMLDMAKSHPRCIKNPEPVCWLREFNDSGMVFLLAFWIGDVHEGRNTPQSEVMLSILDIFRREQIKFSQPGTKPASV
ncbi:MAG: mechanosensitive ion channel domain-containing protein [Pseudomonadota bacterium]